MYDDCKDTVVTNSIEQLPNLGLADSLQMPGHLQNHQDALNQSTLINQGSKRILVVLCGTQLRLQRFLELATERGFQGNTDSFKIFRCFFYVFNEFVYLILGSC